MPSFPNSGARRAPVSPTGAVTAGDSAALLLIESLIHGLIARSILTVQGAVEIIDIAADVEREIHDEKNLPVSGFQSLLEPLSHSLRFDLTN